MDLKRLHDELERCSDERLERLLDLMMRRWPMDPPWERAARWEYLDDKELPALRFHMMVTSEQSGRRRRRLHELNPVHTQEEPIPLKRAVSSRELANVFQAGAVVGILNAWSRWDERRMVLWADSSVPDGWLLGQSDQLERQAIVCLCLERGIPVCHDSVSEGDVQRWCEEERALRAESEWTSAVLLTRPLSGSTVWPRHNFNNQMGGMDEHGMPSGHVGLADIEIVRLYKKRTMVFEGTPEQAAEAAASMRSPWLSNQEERIEMQP